MQQNLLKIAKICQNLPNSLRNFEMPPKFENFNFVKKTKKSLCSRGTKACADLLDFQYNDFLCLFYYQKMAFVCEFQHIPLQKMIFSSMFHTSCGYEIWRHVPNSLRNKNTERHIPYLFFKMVVLAFKSLLSP
jgi:hypothetical protein